MTYSNTQRGSVLFFILIGVALFAALSYTVSSMMRGSGKIGDEKAGIYAAEILSYARSVKEAVNMVRISNGCEDTDISFANPIITGYEHTPAARDECKIFHSNGGGVSYIVPSAESLDSSQSAESLYKQWYISGRQCLTKVGNANNAGCATDGIDNETLILFLPYIKQEICIIVNKKLSNNFSSNPPQEGGWTWHNSEEKFTGVYSEGPSFYGNNKGYYAGCMEGDTGYPPAGTYFFYQVLIAR